MQIQGKTALVTGGAVRVGKAITLALARAGANVVVHYHSSAGEAEATAAEARALGVKALTARADVADAEQVRGLARAVEAQLGGVDILVNSASHFRTTPIPTQDFSAWKQVTGILIDAPFYCANVFGPGMIQRGEGAIVNILDLGRRMSRDGNLIVFDSYADLANENSGTNYDSFATYVYDATADNFRRVLPRSNGDSGAPGGDLQRYGGFTDTDVAGTPSTLILETRMNIKADGTVPANAADGLNPDPNRPVQLYTYPLTVPPASATFKRIAKFPSPTTFLASTRAITSDSASRFAFNMSLTELGGGNLDSSPEVYYMLTPTAINEARISANFATGASRIPVSPTVVPSPSPTATPTPTPTPSPSPTASPSPTPTPTPQSPPAVFGLAPGMRAIMNFQAGIDRPIVERSGVGSMQRSFQLPIQLSGVTMTINGFSCGLVRVSRHRIDFVVPRGLPAAVEGTPYDLVLNNNGTIMRTQVILVPARPDVYSFEGFEGPGGRAKIFNVTNRVHTTEPFTVRTRSIRPFGRVPTKLRIYLTGFNPRIGTGVINVRIGLGTNHFLTILSQPEEVEPGIYAQDVELNDDMDGSGDQPVVVIVAINGQVFASRLDDGAPRTLIL